MPGRDHDQVADSPNRTNAASGLRFLTEPIGWAATQWALHRVHWAVAFAALVLLIGLPPVVGTPGDRPFDPPVAIPGAAMLLLVLLEVAAAAVAPWFVWPTGAAARRDRSDRDVGRTRTVAPASAVVPPDHDSIRTVAGTPSG
ncbi:hypothetical protein [Streptomyces misionensis]|uniref:hypothetical protein n=1 Tax=Streptomyces misionensis TaxID=67331 RepID=UPI00396B5198